MNLSLWPAAAVVNTAAHKPVKNIISPLVYWDDLIRHLKMLSAKYLPFCSGLNNWSDLSLPLEVSLSILMQLTPTEEPQRDRGGRH